MALLGHDELTHCGRNVSPGLSQLIPLSTIISADQFYSQNHFQYPFDLNQDFVFQEVTFPCNCSISMTQGENSYHQVSNIRRTKSQHLKGSVLWLSLQNPLKPDVKSRKKM